LQKKSPLEPAAAAKVALQVAQQLAATSDAHIVHPGRIHLTKEGAARLLPTSAEELALPAVVEYPAYASPEEIHGQKPDLRSALYSLGCTLHETLTGQPPFTGADPKQILHAHLEAPLPEALEKTPGVTPGLAETVRGLLEKDPELRVQTAEELIRRLKQALLQAGVPVPQESAARPQRAAAAPAPAKAPSLDEEIGLDTDLAPLPPARRPAAPAAAPSAASAAHAPRQRAASAAQPAARPPRGAPRLAPPGPRPGAPRHAARPGAAAARSAPLAGRARTPARGRERELDLDEELEEEPAWTPRERRTFPITIAGAIIGVLIGGFVWYKKNEAHEARLKEHYREHAVAHAREEHKKRKKLFEDQVAGERKEVQNALTRGKSSPADQRQDSLLASMRILASASTAPTLGAEISKSWTPPSPKLTEEMQEEDKAYAARKAEAEKLFEEGRYGDAVERLIEDSNLIEKRHGKELAEIQARYEKALEARYREDKIKVERLTSAGEADQAIEILRGGLVYGDAQLRKEIEAAIDKIQKQVAIQASAGTAGAEGDEAADAAAEEKPDGDGEEAAPKSDEPAEEEFEEPKEKEKEKAKDGEEEEE
jgi:hypothetical protein